MHQSAIKHTTGEAVYCDDIPPVDQELFLAVVTSSRAHAKIISIDASEALAFPGVVDVITAEDVPGDNNYKGEVFYAQNEVICVGQIVCTVAAHTYAQAREAAKRVKIAYEDIEPRIITIEEYTAAALNIPRNRVACHMRRAGGAFGGKVTKPALLGAISAVAANKTGHPIRFVLERGDDMLITAGRHPLLGKYKVGFMNNGVIKAADVEYYVNGGCTPDESEMVVEFIVLKSENAYHIPNFRCRGRPCKTNLPSNTAFRGFGFPQSTVVVETYITAVASQCNLLPEEVKEINMYKRINKTAYKQTFNPEPLRRCWKECLEKSSFYARKAAAEEFNKKNYWKKRGLAVIPMKYTIGIPQAYYNQAAALVHIYLDGSVLVTHGGCELGQGLHTKMIQVASRELNIPQSYIHLSETSTVTVPNAVFTAGSMGTDINGKAVQNACQILMARLQPIIRKNPKGKWEDWVAKAFEESISLSTTGYFKGYQTYMDWEKEEGNPYPYFVYGAACSEVEVDCLTGAHKLLRTDIFMDAAFSINPALDIGQIEGAFIQGMGLYTIEELKYSPEGVLYSRSPDDYKIPTVTEIPEEFYVTLVRSRNPIAIYSSKGLGEAGMFLGTSVFFAIYDAVSAARRERGLTKTFTFNSPATPELIRMTCVDQFTDMVIERNADPEVTLLNFLRKNRTLFIKATTREKDERSKGDEAEPRFMIGPGPNKVGSEVKVRLTGTKYACGRGGCGACTVMVSKHDPMSRKIRHFSVTACLVPICSLHGAAVTTVEGVGSIKTRLHPVQERIAKSHGTQCGFCTPGMVMSMYTLLRNHPQPSEEQLMEALGGNLCRCTGYRSILAGGRTFCMESNGCQQKETGKCCLDQGENDSSSLDRKSDICTELFAKEEFQPLDPTQELIFPPELLRMAENPEKRTLIFYGERVTWISPGTLKDLLELKGKHPEAPLILGNTSLGPTMKSQGHFHPILLSPARIPELSTVTKTSDGLTIGAGCSLAQMRDILAERILELPEEKTQTFRALLKHLPHLAGQQIRNMASLGGHIISRHCYSDLNPVLAVGNATLNLISEEGSRQIPLNEYFLAGLASADLRPKEILESVHIPHSRKKSKNRWKGNGSVLKACFLSLCGSSLCGLSSIKALSCERPASLGCGSGLSVQWEFVSAFRQAQCQQNALPDVNAGMRVLFKEGTDTIEDLSVAYGGVGAATICAQKSCQQLLGRRWNELMLDEACRLLLDEVSLPGSAPGGRVEFRRTLVVSFLFKFYLEVLQELKKPLKLLSVPDSRRYPEIPDRFLSALEDFPLTIPQGVQTYQSVTPHQPLQDPVGRPIMHLSGLKHATGEAIFCDDIPMVDKELFMALVTSTRAHAKIISIDSAEALELPGVVDVITAEDIPGTNGAEDDRLLAVDEVFCVGQIICAVVAETDVQAKQAIEMIKITYEDLEPVIFTIEDAIKHNSFLCPEKRLEQGNIEEAFEKADQIVEGEVHVGGQEHFYMETQRVLVIPKTEDKELDIYVSTQDPAHVQKTVSSTLNVPINRITCHVKRVGGGFGGKVGRPAVFGAIAAVGAVKTGHPIRLVLDREDDMLITGGRHPLFGKYKVGFMNNGRIKAMDVECYINGGCTLDDSEMVTEFLILKMENAYKIRNLRFRGRACMTNLPSNTAFRGFGFPQGTLVTESCITAVAAKCGLLPEQIREKNMYKTVDKTIYKQAFNPETLIRCWNECLDKSSFHSRRMQVEEFNKKNYWKKKGIAIIPMKFSVGFAATSYHQAAALVHIYTDGSVLVTHGGNELGQGIHTKMLQIEAAFEQRISLSATGYFRGYKAFMDWEKGEGDPFPYYVYGAACSEVEIDCLTGAHKKIRTDVVMDACCSLNPAIDIGQIEGSFIQGMGLYTTEELKYSPEGVLYSRSPDEYKIPTINDVPEEFNVSLLPSSHTPLTIYSSKGLGESGMFLGSSVFFAIADAVATARRERDLAEDFTVRSPATPERVRMSCADRFTEMVTKTIMVDTLVHPSNKSVDLVFPVASISTFYKWVIFSFIPPRGEDNLKGHGKSFASLKHFPTA
ncbi:Aldehyde oxidase [Tupaia chinensis]|uniref:Aldehyde oxidase n=1 Tax=Tupaia chinensis TaxID=246437 RepID=L9KIC7_TUPCH|nr:Aldehyde oxidase [Tupaia chinensis]